MDLHRGRILPEDRLPEAAELIARGGALADAVTVGASAFLGHHDVACEAEFKRREAAAGRITVHSQIGYRDPAKTKRAWREIWEKAGERGGRVDRYGICLDWSMGFRPADRAKAQKGTGLILESPEAFAALTAEAPVAPHFGDFVIGMPAAVENTVAALGAGATAIGNLGQYFTFRLPGHDDDVGDTAATVEALALAAAQPVDILVHSNLDDGFAALFTDLACSLGAVLLEQYIVEDLIGGAVSHCYGHSFSEPAKRMVFQLALTQVSRHPGTMVYGNTVAYDGDGPENYAALGAYLGVDIAAQRHAPSGHAINPVPITEAARIPDIDEVVDAAVFAGRLVDRMEVAETLYDFAALEASAADLVAGAQRFKASVLSGLELAGIDIHDPFEMLLALRRIGSKRLEEAFGPGAPDPERRRGRVPLLQASTIAALEGAAEKKVAAVDTTVRRDIAEADLRVYVCTTDVHEYGKILLEETLQRLGVDLVDGGVHAEPARIAADVARSGADAIAISTYNGVALDYLRQVRRALMEADLDIPILMGGKTNQIPQGSNTSLPVDVSDDLIREGALVCRRMEDILPHLLRLAEERAEDKGR
ncbi:MAG: cobalamin-dependent protein [Alphaproteobacteria bacterium]|nr:cobalamin-dependent protein [Alphaproteobacteria bacterium]